MSTPAPVFVLLVLAANFAVCQSVAPPSANPKSFFAPPSDSGQPGRDFHFEPEVWSHLPMYPAPSAVQRFDSAKIDPEFAIRPPKSSYTARTPRIPMSGNLYPDLRLLPTQVAQLDAAAPPFPQAKAEPIPRTWTGFKMEQIPRTWDNFKAVPVKSTPAPHGK